MFLVPRDGPLSFPTHPHGVGTEMGRRTASPKIVEEKENQCVTRFGRPVPGRLSGRLGTGISGRLQFSRPSAKKPSGAFIDHPPSPAPGACGRLSSSRSAAGYRVDAPRSRLSWSGSTVCGQVTAKRFVTADAATLKNSAPVFETGGSHGWGQGGSDPGWTGVGGAGGYSWRNQLTGRAPDCAVFPRSIRAQNPCSPTPFPRVRGSHSTWREGEICYSCGGTVWKPSRNSKNGQREDRWACVDCGRRVANPFGSRP